MASESSRDITLNESSIMIDPELESARQRVMVAHSLEDLVGEVPFSIPPLMLVEQLRGAMKKLEQTIDPARYHHPGDKEAAHELASIVRRLWDDGRARAQRGLFGLLGRGNERPTHATKSFSIGDRRYYLGAKTDGSDGTLFEGFLEVDGRALGNVTVKRARDEKENLLLENETRILEILTQNEVPQWKHLPRILDSFTSGERRGVVYRALTGHTLAEVRTHRTHAKGVEQRHMVWMLDRMLSCLGYSHRRGVVHGNIAPEHVVIEPSTHNVVLFGWGASALDPAETGERVPTFSEEFSAPEVKKRGMIGPWSDMYSLGKVMIWLLGGNPARNTVPDGVAEPIRKFLLQMVREDHLERPSDAWVLHAEECRIKDALWRRQFLHFDMS